MYSQMSSLLASDVPVWLVRIIAFLYGTLWGSFFNVAIYRWPRGMSVVMPASHCPHCKVPIAFYRNVPLVSYVLLQGRSACCGARIHRRYFFVELLSGALALSVVERFILGVEPSQFFTHALLESVLYFFFVGALIIATFVDLEWMEIPDEVSLPGAALGLVTIGFRTSHNIADVAAVALGAGGGYLVIQLLFVWGYERVFGRRGMGEGDAKFLMMIGAFLGWQGGVFALLIGSMQGVVFAMCALLLGRSLAPTRPDETEAAQVAQSAPIDAQNKGPLKMPFGPFLALGALEYLLFGDSIIQWYATAFLMP